MLKLIAAIILSLSFIFLLKECVVSMRASSLQPSATVEEKKQAKTPQVAANQAEKNVRFYPPVPAVLPDLNKGYLFNEERSLEGAEEAGKEEGEAAGGQSVDMETVFYAGSVIIGDMHKGLITYPSAPAPPKRAARPGKIGPVLAPEGIQKQRNYQQLAVGDSFSGYKVAAVEPDRIVFKKGGGTVVKLLNDPKKTRLEAPAPQPPPAQQHQQQKTPNANAATNQARQPLGKAMPPGAVQSRPVQSSREMRSARPVGSVTRTVPRNMIRVPGVPPAAASAPAALLQRQPVPAAAAPAPAPQPQPTTNMPSQPEDN